MSGTSQLEALFEGFLADFRRNRWAGDGLPPGSHAIGRYAAPEASSVEVVLAAFEHRPRKEDVRRVWRARHGGRAARVLLVAGYPGATGVLVAGLDDTIGEVPVEEVTREQAESAARRALEAPSRRSAEEALAALFERPDDNLPTGLRNSGLFTAHSLTASVPTWPGWAQACASARTLRGQQGTDLLSGLGWTIQHHGSELVLRDGVRDRAVAMLLEGDEVFDRPALRLGLGISPVEQALQVARDLELDWVLALRRATVRLYPVNPDRAVARAGSASYVEVDVDALVDRDLGYAWMLLASEALRPGGSVERVLEDSREHATSLAERLRERIYRDVVPGLAESIARHHQDLTERGLERAYHETLVVLFRLLFVAYAEDRRLLPYRANAMYTRHALRTIARDLAERSDPAAFDETATNLWDDLVQIWRAVRDGNRDWGVPAYGGSLFRTDSAAGQSIEDLRLTNAEIGPALDAMLVDVAPGGDARGPIDFRALSVREFGTIYEGLLESSLSLATTDLAVDPGTGAYIPAKKGQRVEYPSGSVYFHDAAGTRKATGSYFTQEFAVEHLLDEALTPMLDAHLERVVGLLDAGRPADAAAALFDFRVADIAMGSGHFLVAVVDRIARSIEALLATRPELATELRELVALREGALHGLRQAGLPVEGSEAPQITQGDLLRRQIAKRCVYGVDVNEIAVDLARLALWIHTFVPGLPMSDLSRTLVCGDSLTGIGTIAELLDTLEPDAAGGQSLFRGEIEDALRAGGAARTRAALLAEATVAEADDARRLRAESADLLEPTRRAADVAAAARLGVLDPRMLTVRGFDAVVAAATEPHVEEAVGPLEPLHFPVAFPEVFGRERAGFDVVLGNPPWDEVMVEEPKFWQRYEHGVMGLDPAPQQRRIRELRAERPDLLPMLAAEQARAARVRDALLRGPYPGIGTGDVDYYKAFSWRYWQLLAPGGRMGTVFPRSLLNAAGSAEWREAALGGGQVASVVTLANTGRWVFPDVDGRYTVVLVVVVKSGRPAPTVGIAGPFHSRTEFDAGHRDVAPLRVETLLGWGNGAAFPLLPTTRAAEVFDKFREHPRFDAGGSWEFRPVAEFHATNDRPTFDAGTRADDRWPVYTGATFNLWEPDFGDPYTWADPDVVVKALHQKRHRQSRNRRTAFYGLPASVVNDPLTLPCRGARVVFRDIARATDQRTAIAALAPPDIVLTNTAPYLLRVRGDEQDEAFMLGVLSSVTFDWYARRYVELHLNMHVLNAFPVPRPAAADPLRTRVVEIAGRLAAIDHRYVDWAVQVGVPVGSANEPATKNDLIAELDAVVAHLYGLDRDDVAHVFQTFHRGWDYEPRLAAVLAHYDRWATGDGR